MNVATLTAPRILAPPASALLPSGAAAGPLDRAVIDAPTPPAAPAAAPPSPASPPLPAANPWPELEHRGLLAATQATPGPLGPMLSDASRQGLRDALQRLQAHGITFERQRRFRLPFLMKQYVPLAPGAMEAALEKEPAAFKHRLNANVAGHAHMRLSRLDDVQALDVFYGLGETAAPARRQGVARALRGLEAAGWKLSRYDYSGYSYHPTDPSQAFTALGQGTGARLEASNPATKASVEVGGGDDVVALNFFEGSGQDEGLTNAALARQLKAAESHGLVFSGLDPYRRRGDGSAYAAYGFLAKSSSTMYAHHPGKVGVAANATDLANLPHLEQRVSAAEDLYQRILAPAATACGLDNSGQALLDAALDGSDAFSPEIRAAVLAEVLRARSGKTGEDDAVQQAVGIARRIEGLTSDPLALADLANQYARQCQHAGVQAATSFLDTIDGGLHRMAGSADEQEHVQNIFMAVLKATGSLYAAGEAVDLVRIPIGQETDADRLKAFLDIAARESEATIDGTVRDYRAVLVHRLPGESLMAAGARMENLLHALSVGRQQGRAADAFATIQEGVKEGRFGKLSADDVLQRFEQALVVCASVDDALQSVRSDRAGGVPAGPQTIQPEDGAVVIGGIRVPVRTPSR